MTDFVTQVFGFRIPVTPVIILPLLVLATILLAYVVYFLLTDKQYGMTREFIGKQKAKKKPDEPEQIELF